MIVAGCKEKGKGTATSTSTPTATPTSTASATATPTASATAKRPPPDLNVLFVTIDSLRADMPWAGYDKPVAPRLTELEKRSVSYTRAYSISSYTSKSLGGLLAGKLPSGLRRDGYFFATYPKDNLFFPRLLQAAGVKTLAAHAHGYFKAAGFEQGFDAWEIIPNLKFDNTTDPNVTSPDLEAIAEKQLAALPPEARFFAWYHFLDPHDQYIAHEKDGIPAGKTLRDRYDGEVTYTDRYIGKLLDFVARQPWAGRTAIVVSSDHGEGFGEHGRFAHGFELYEELVRVPLFFVLPGVEPRHIDARRSAIDLAPTLCELFGVRPDDGFEGVSLVGELYGGPAAEREPVLDLPQTSDNEKRRAFYHGRFKLIAFGTDAGFHLFDLEADPQEKKPVMRGDDYQDMVARYRAAAKAIKEVPPYACREGCLAGTKKPE